MFDRLVTSVVKNRVLILLLMAVLVGWGLYSWRQVPVDAYPELTNNQVQILTRVPGMSPVEVEKLVTYPIEISMTNLEGVQDNRSLSQFGLSVGRIQDAIDLAIGGDRVSTVLEGDRRFALVGKLQKADCNSAASIRSLPLTPPTARRSACATWPPCSSRRPRRRWPASRGSARSPSA